MRKFTAAAADMVAHVLAHRQLESSLPGETLKEWTAAVVAWETDPTNTNPFEVQIECTLRLSLRSIYANIVGTSAHSSGSSARTSRGGGP